QTAYAAVDPYTGTGPVIMRQIVVVTLKSKHGMPRWVKDFYFTALFADGSRQTRHLQPAMDDRDTTWIQPGEVYKGRVTFDGDRQIVSLGCSVNPGL
ncbi:MAG: hypothetical protein AB1442_05930, partial [Nitrospirota bacterium]